MNQPTIADIQITEIIYYDSAYVDRATAYRNRAQGEKRAILQENEEASHEHDRRIPGRTLCSPRRPTR